MSRRVSQSVVWVHTYTMAKGVSRAAERLSRTNSALNLSHDLSDIYPLRSPLLFHKTLDVLLLLSCTYLVGVWVWMLTLSRL